jgi:hypothetical protein
VPALARTEQTGSIRVPLARLDDQGLDRVDALKLDVQGSELAVLRGAPRALETALAVQVEVEFNPIWDGQPLFGDVDALLRAAGFVLWRLDDLHHHAGASARPDAPLVAERRAYDERTVRSRGAGGQLFWGQATYVRPSPPDALRAAVVAWAADLDDLAAAHLAASGDPAATAVLRRGRRRRRAARVAWAACHRDALGAVRRLVAVRRLARRGCDAEEIAARTGLTVENVERLLGFPLA